MLKIVIINAFDANDALMQWWLMHHWWNATWQNQLLFFECKIVEKLYFSVTTTNVYAAFTSYHITAVSMYATYKKCIAVGLQCLCKYGYWKARRFQSCNSDRHWSLVSRAFSCVHKSNISWLLGSIHGLPPLEFNPIFIQLVWDVKIGLHIALPENKGPHVQHIGGCALAV